MTAATATFQLTLCFRRIAHMEMRVLMAKFLYNFEFELAFPDEDWVSTKKAYGAWNNSELKMKLRAVGE